MKVDRWGWQQDNRPLSSVSAAGLLSSPPRSPVLPLHPSLTNTPHPPHLPPHRPHTPFYHSIINMLPHNSPYPFILPRPPCLHSFYQCHCGPMLTEAFIKCQLYTGDHTVEGKDTMISDPKRSTCFSSC